MNRRRNKSTILKTAILLLATNSVISLNVFALGQGNRLFTKLDENGNGVIEQAEVNKHKENRFKNLDKNNNGYLEPNEMEVKRDWLKDRLKNIDFHASLDVNDDGVVSLEEYLESASIIDLADTDANGSVDAQELTAFVKARKK